MKNVLAWTLAAVMFFCSENPSSCQAGKGTGKQELIPYLTMGNIRIGYLPGDACFPVASGGSFKYGEGFDPGLLDEKPPMEVTFKVRYPPMINRGFPHYYYGFASLKIMGLGEFDSLPFIDFHSLLASERDRIDLDNHSLGRHGDLTNNQLLLLVVNRDFNFDEDRFFVRYNEEWSEPRPSMVPDDYTPKMLRHLWRRNYQPHIPKVESVFLDLHHAKSVPPLKVKFPETITSEKLWLVNEPVSMDYQDMALIGFPTDDPYEAFQNKLGSSYYKLTSDGIYRCTWILNSDLEKTLHEVRVDDTN